MKLFQLVFVTFLTALLAAQTFASKDAFRADKSLVYQTYNHIQTQDFSGQNVVIFGCGHGNHNEGGCQGDEGDHSHTGVICIDKRDETKADHVLDVTRQIVPDCLKGTADVVYFEYLHEATYNPMTFANAFLCLKDKGIIVWDVYHKIPGQNDLEAAKCLAFYKENVIGHEINFLNKEDRFQGVFNIGTTPQDQKAHFSAGLNPFNGRKNAWLFHIRKQDLDVKKLDLFTRFFQPDVIKSHLLQLHGLLKQEDCCQSFKEIRACVAELKKYADKKRSFNLGDGYQHFSVRVNAIDRNAEELLSGRKSSTAMLEWYEKLIRAWNIELS